MDIDTLFQIGSSTALVGWVFLLGSPFIPKLADLTASLIIPFILSVIYVALIFVFWTRAEGGFDTLSNVMLLFTQKELVLAGWLHFLAFDLFVGAWVARTARDEGIPFLLVIPCLFLTFLFGPAGFLAFSTLRAAYANVSHAKAL